MIQQNKKGFSLVEVMILFTVLAVALAAALPVVTRKSSPIPNKINHGVYRCINTGNGLLQELYTASRQVSQESLDGSSEKVSQCSFRVPEAALYKVDLYSAGAGGTEGAEITVQQDDNRSAVYKVNTTYADFKYTNAEGSSVTPNFSGANDSNKALLSKLSQDQIRYFFAKESVIKSGDTLNAGDGGDAAIKSYKKAQDYMCVGYGVKIAEAQAKLDELMNRLNPEHKDYDSNLKMYDDAMSSAHQSAEEMKVAQELALERGRELSEYTRYPYGQLNILDNAIDSLKNYGHASFCETDKACAYRQIRNAAAFKFNTGQGIIANKQTYWNTVEQDIISNLAPTLAAEYVTQAKADKDHEFEKAMKEYKEDLDTYNTYIDGRKQAVDSAVAKAREEYVKKHGESYAASHFASSQEKKNAEKDAKATYDKDYKDNHNGKIPTEPTEPVNNKSPYTVKEYLDSVYQDYYESNVNYKSSSKTKLSEYIRTNADESDSAGKLIIPMSRRADELGPGWGIQSKYSSYMSKILEELLVIHKEIDDKVAELKKYLDGYDSFWEQADAYGTKKEGYEKEEAGFKSERDSEETPIIAEKNQQETLYNDLLEGNLKSILSNYGYSEANIMDVSGKTQSQFKQYCKTVFEDERIVPATGSDSKSGSFGGRGKRMRVEYPLTASEKMGNIEKYLQDVDKNFKSMYCGNVDPNGIASSCTVSGPGELRGAAKSSSNYEKDRNTQGTFDIKGNKHELKTEDGKDLVGVYLAWRIPEFTPSGIVPHDLSLIKSLPTGGERAIMKVDESNAAKTYQEVVIPKGADIKTIQKLIFENKNYSYEIQKSDSKNGDPVEMLQNSKEQATVSGFPEVANKNAKIDYVNSASDTTKSKPLSQSPQIKISASLWTKDYKLGQDGNPGKTLSFITSNLGSKCTFDVPAPGAVLTYGGGQSIRDLEDALKVSMTCRNKNKEIVFDKELEGGTYNPELAEAADSTKFYWYKGVTSHRAELDHLEAPQWRPTSIWAKVYDLMGGVDSYNLNSYRVGAPGKGTVMIDYCVEPKGHYQLNLERVAQYGSVTAAYDIYTPSNAPPPQRYDYNGIKDGYDCYGGASDGEYSFSVDDDDPSFSVHAEKGGGGAVVITW